MNTNNQPLYSLTLGQFKELIKQILKEEILKKHSPPEPDEGLEELLKIDEVQKIFKVSKVTIFSWIKKGKLKSLHIGNRLYFKKREIKKTLGE